MSTMRIAGLLEDAAAAAMAQAAAGLLPPSGSVGTYTDPQGNRYTFIVDGRYPANIRPGTLQRVSSSLASRSATVAARTASVRTPLASSTSIMKPYPGVAAPAPMPDEVPTGYPEPPPESKVSPVLIAGGVLAALALGFVAYKTLA